MKRIGIIGGGAAGMTAAIAAAGQGARVTILEANDRLGKKYWRRGTESATLETKGWIWRSITPMNRLF